ncbi:MAG: OmpA family protein [Saprospiraceae bacterium]|nr:OmpA family protein [Saprospiraceae bacterium]
MIGLIATLTIILLAVIIVQIARISEIAAKIRGEEEVEAQKNKRTAFYCLVFLIGFLIFCVGSAWYYKNSMLGYGPHEAASAHGNSLDRLFDLTLFFTGIVFVLTHIALFWFSYKYKADKNRVATFLAHSTKLEVIWTVIPTIVLIFLVVRGLIVWNDVMPDVGPDDDYIEIEATGYQFAWDLRYPGPDGKLGKRDFRLINTATNPLGQDWTDEKNLDDFMPSKIVLPVDQKVRVRITAKDVLHNFYLPHFRVKMDAVPGLPTYFIFTPIKTTQEYREELRKYPEWQVPADPTDPDSKQRWEEFNYELACAELCGKGHYSMKRIVEIVDRGTYEDWLKSQNSFYLGNIRNTDADPYKGDLLKIEIDERKVELKSEFMSALESDDAEVIRLKHVFFETGKSNLQDISEYELDNVAALIGENENVKVELSGHTDSTGDDDLNMALSEARAKAVRNYLLEKGVSSASIIAKGYGETAPIDSNETPEGRQNNRRTELKILAK